MTSDSQAQFDLATAENDYWFTVEEIRQIGKVVQRDRKFGSRWSIMDGTKEEDKGLCVDSLLITNGSVEIRLEKRKTADGLITYVCNDAEFYFSHLVANLATALFKNYLAEIKESQPQRSLLKAQK